MGRGRFFDRWQRERNDAAAVWTNGQMGESLFPLVRRQNVLDEGAELICVWVLPGLKEIAHILSDAGMDAVIAVNGVVCEVCSRARRFNSISRGSAPRASSAARLLRPPVWRLGRRRLRRSATRRLSRRLTVASWI